MERIVRFTPQQIQALLDYLSGKKFKSGQPKQDIQFLYNPNTPKDIYVKYTNYSLLDDNSISSELEVKCVNPDGSVSNCYEQFTNLAERMAFASDFIEIDIDEKGKMEIK